MNRDKYYSGIDWFRLFASLLVIAVHTSPLSGISETGDFILTRVISRIAVPFFFMTSGFFTVTRYSRDTGRLRRFICRMALIYAVAIVLYLPINIYNGYFRCENLLPNIIKDIVFDGTAYHLWYLPAAMTGAAIAWLLVRKLDYKRGFAVAAVLYAIGLFGDSYYGFISGVPVVGGFYGLLFSVSDYTRNGVFFAPIFMLLGGFIADSRRRLPWVYAISGFTVSFALMLGEGLILHRLGVQRHDSMYVFLVPCVLFLFGALLHFRGKRVMWLRGTALAVYIVHPMMIVVVRMLARPAGLWWLLVYNSLVHFAVVSLLSLAAGISVTAVMNRYANSRKLSMNGYRPGTDRAYIEIDTDSLVHNADVLRAALPSGCELMAVVKTEAYGHGAFCIATLLEKNGVRAFAVATADEGISLRRYGIRGDILVLGYTDVHRAAQLKKYRLMQTVIDADYAERLNSQQVPVQVHVKIDTGMHRLGIADSDVSGVRRIFDMKYLKVDGIYTHLCCAESQAPDDIAFTYGQIQRFYTLIDALKADGIMIPKLHIQSSCGLLNYPGLKCDYVRAGIALYGVLGTPTDKTRLELDLHPVLSLKARVAMIRNVATGESVGYDRAFITARDSRIAILTIGYGDGLPRSLSNGCGHVRIGDAVVPIVGRICMDQLAVDVTDAQNVSVGDVATLIDSVSPLTAPDVAAEYGSISNELLSRLGVRLPVVEKSSM